MATVDTLITYGMQEIGKPYVYGDEGPNSFDCSGLMQWIFGRVGVKLPRTAAQQQQVAAPVSDPKPGDLVFWGAPAHHVALYLGGGRILAAPNSRSRVRVQQIYGSPTYGRISGLTGSGPVAQAVANTATNVGLSIDDFLGAAIDNMLVVFGIAAGLALMGLGAWRVAKT